MWLTVSWIPSYSQAPSALKSSGCCLRSPSLSKSGMSVLDPRWLKPKIKCLICPQHCCFTDQCTTTKSSGILQLFIYVPYGRRYSWISSDVWLVLNRWLSGSSLKGSMTCMWSAALPRFASVFPSVGRVSMYFWCLTCWTLFGWSSAGRSLFSPRYLRLFVTDGFFDCLEDCFSTPAIRCGHILPVAVWSVVNIQTVIIKHFTISGGEPDR